MLLPTLLMLALAAAPAPVPPAVRDALAAALAVPRARLVVGEYAARLPERCALRRAQPSQPVQGSARVALRLDGVTPEGLACSGWAWARVDVYVHGWVTVRTVRDGEPLAGAVQPAERELKPGRPLLTELPPGALAARALAAGQALGPESVRGTGPRPGDRVTVIARAGGITLTQPAQLVPCGAGRTCARLPTGRRVEGTLDGNQLLVDL